MTEIGVISNTNWLICTNIPEANPIIRLSTISRPFKNNDIIKNHYSHYVLMNEVKVVHLTKSSKESNTFSLNGSFIIANTFQNKIFIVIECLLYNLPQLLYITPFMYFTELT